MLKDIFEQISKKNRKKCWFTGSSEVFNFIFKLKEFRYSSSPWDSSVACVIKQRDIAHKKNKSAKLKITGGMTWHDDDIRSGWSWLIFSFSIWPFFLLFVFSIPSIVRFSNGISVDSSHFWLSNHQLNLRKKKSLTIQRWGLLYT